MDDTTRLLRAAQAGDRLSLAAWIRASQADVWRWCAAAAGRDRADDLTQEVFLRALRSLDGFRGEASSRTWLLAIARRTLADELRGTYRRRALRDRLQRQPEVQLTTAPSDVPSRVDLSEAVKQLDPDRRDAFVLTQVLGLSYAEAAEALDVPVGTVRSRLSRARGDLAGLLGVDDAAAASEGESA